MVVMSTELERWKKLFLEEFYRELKTGQKLNSEAVEQLPTQIPKWKHTPLERIVTIVDEYLFGNKDSKELADNHGVSPNKISVWARNEGVLREIARRRGMNSEQIIELRNRKPGVHKWSLENVDRVFDRMREELGRKPSYEEFAASYKGALIAIQASRYMPNIRSWTEYLIHRGFEAKVGGWKEKPSLETKARLVGAYLFDSRGIVKLCKDLETSYSSIIRWCNEDEVLMRVADERGVNYEEVVEKRNAKLETRQSRVPIQLETKVDAIDAYLFDGNVSRIIQTYNVSRSSISRWCKNESILTGIARKRGIEYSEVLRIRDEKVYRSSRR